MAKVKLPANPTHRAVLATGETVDFYGPPHGSYPTHWTFGGADKDGNPDGSPVRSVPVVSTYPLHLHPTDAPPVVEEDDEE